MKSIEDILKSYGRLIWSSSESAPHCEMVGRFSNGVMGWQHWSNNPDSDVAMSELYEQLRKDMWRWIIWLERYRGG